ncbi:Peptidoglycan/LPS O-acetylase OafA/YrhL, contains acyltransferase and SGNH-hydrolase domains [Rosenbergiella nectarea]|uniref:Peptidoglycan/LPS O-acetylase OafA/YrhL, contains acyltransferase and SGNH-hydrolase domains n=2 Tax=Rosenbergiella nectarea TaxID=988801 RepID=A0A1H9KCV1_9GAMM|nr:Peptidoglycan/LPS O-acetylase OafA/YrhL, contains acyltransferase and SGNH-hydrolase domains [Rosenbergiella nectarea]
MLTNALLYSDYSVNYSFGSLLMQQAEFRYDVNGLRAYALLLVVFYHFNLPLFHAGFIGVDIFFVISGYFMTKIIVDQLYVNNFKIKNFFYARFIRIVPPLLLVTITFYCVSFLLLNPEDFQYYCKYVIKSLTFTSNISLLKEADDYFAANSAKNVLLHTWSLSVEWQFYLLYPFLFILLNKVVKHPRGLITILSLLLLSSFLFSVYQSTINRAYDFYMLTTRAWEMLAGGLVYLFESSRTSQQSRPPILLKLFGIALVLLSLITINDKVLWPGYLAILVVIGSSLIIYSANNSLRIFNHPVIYNIGLASYSIYLWHWPIHFLANYYFPHPTTINNIGFSALSIIIGYLSYKFIERKVISWAKGKGQLFSFSFFLCTVLIFIGVADHTRKNSGFPWRGGENYLSLINKIKMPSPEDGWCFYSIASHHEFTVGLPGVQCKVGNTIHPRKKGLLFGDSYAGQYIPFWQSVGENNFMQLQAITTNWCNPSTGNDFSGPHSSRAYQQCLFNRHYLLDHISDYDFIVLAGSWTQDFDNPQSIEGLRDLITKIQQKNVPLIIMDEPYQFEENVGALYKQNLWRHRYFDIQPYTSVKMDNTLRATSQILDQLIANPANTLHLRRSDLFSPTHYAVDDIPYSLDGGHISVLGSLAAERYFIAHGGSEKLQHFLKQ